MTVKFSTRKKPTVAQLKKLYAHAWWTKDRAMAGIARVLRRSHLISSAWEGSELVAFARLTTDGYRAVIWDVIVHPDYHRRGIGRRVVNALLREPRLRTVEGFWLFTTDKQPFYKKLGFKFFPENAMIYRRKRP